MEPSKNQDWRQRLLRALNRASLPAPTALIRVLHIVTLSAFAVAQPVYDRVADKAAFLNDRGIEGLTLIVLVLLCSIAVPGLFFLAEWVANRISPRVGQAARLIVNDVLFTAIAFPFLNRLDPVPGLILLPVGLAAGVAGAWAYERFAVPRKIISVAVPGAVLFPVWFLFLSSARGILRPPPESQFSITSPVPVVLIVFDEFCGDSLMDENREIDAARFSGFAQLAETCTWYRNATSVNALTEYAVPSLLSGNYSRGATYAPVLANYPQNLFTLIRNSDRYDLAAFEPVTRLCPENRRQDSEQNTGLLNQLKDILPTIGVVYAYHLFPKDWQTELPPIRRAWFGLIEDRDVDRADRRGAMRYSWGHNRDRQFEHFLDCISDSERPALYFCHFLLPHVPWCYLPSGKKYVEDGTDWDLLNFDVHGEVAGDWGDDELYVQHNQARYLLQIGFADRLISQLIERLKETGTFDRCLLIVTADHGVSFRTGEPRRWLSDGNLQDLMPVPLFVKRPGENTASVSDRNVETIDILPTIVDVLGTSLPVPVDGRSVFDVAHPERPHKFMYDGPNVRQTPAHPDDANSARILQLKRFGSGTTRPDSLFEVGPRPDLIGRATNEFEVAAAEGIEIELTRCPNTPEDLANGIVPCHLEGNVRGSAPRPVELAIAVDGTIRAVTRTYLLDGLRDTWTAMIPESSFASGNYAIELFVVSSSGQTTRLHRPAVRRAERN